MSDFEKHMNKYYDAETNEESQKHLLKALEVAEQENDMNMLIKCHLKLSYTELFLGHENVFIDHLFFVFNHINADIINSDREIHYDLLWNGKFITALARYSTFSKDMILDIFEYVKGFYEGSSQDLKPLYGVLIYYYDNGLDLGFDMKDVLKKWKNGKNEQFNDCPACLKDTEICHCIREGKFKDAIKLSHDFDKDNFTCGEAPSLTYARLLYPLVKECKLELAEKYAGESYNLCKNDLDLVPGIIKIIAYKVTTDVDEALKIYIEYIDLFRKIEPELIILDYCFTSYLLFNKLSRKMAKVLLNLNGNITFYDTKGLTDHFKNQYQLLITEFDKRNGATYLSVYYKDIENVYNQF